MNRNLFQSEFCIKIEPFAEFVRDSIERRVQFQVCQQADLKWECRVRKQLDTLVRDHSYINF